MPILYILVFDFYIVSAAAATTKGTRRGANDDDDEYDEEGDSSEDDGASAVGGKKRKPDAETSVPVEYWLGVATHDVAEMTRQAALDDDIRVEVWWCAGMLPGRSKIPAAVNELEANFKMLYKERDAKSSVPSKDRVSVASVVMLRPGMTGKVEGGKVGWSGTRQLNVGTKKEIAKLGIGYSFIADGNVLVYSRSLATAKRCRKSSGGAVEIEA